MSKTNVLLQYQNVKIFINQYTSDSEGEVFIPLYRDGFMCIELISHLNDTSQLIVRHLLRDNGYELDGNIELDTRPYYVDRLRRVKKSIEVVTE